MSTYFPRAVGNPRELPELRAALLEMSYPGGVWEQVEMQKLLMDIVGPDPTVVDDAAGGRTITGPQGYTRDEMEQRIGAAGWHAGNTVRWYREKLPEAQLIHVSPEMTQFVCAAAEAVPHDLTLSLEDAPSPSALVVFGAPVIGTDAGPERPGEQVRVDGIVWGEVGLPPRDVPWWERVVGREASLLGLSIAMFRMVAPEHDDRMGLDLDRVIWVPLGRTDWPWGDALSVKPTEYLPNQSAAQWDSMMEDRRLVAALWATINQRRLVETSTVRPDSHARKRLERRGHVELDERVQVIHLRRTEYQALEPVEGSGRHVKVRFPVRPFYRRQPYGPGRSLRRVTLIPAHWRGPDGAPIVHAERIWSVDK